MPEAARAGSIHVPVYCTVYLGNREVQVSLAVTLIARNTLLDRELVVHQEDYHDTAANVAM